MGNRQNIQSNNAPQSQQLKQKPSNQNEMKCGVCLTEINQNQKLKIEPCGHTYCRKCITYYFETLLKENKIIKCLNERCKNIIQPIFLTQKQLMSVDQVKRYTKIMDRHEQMKKQNIVGCFQANCVGILDKHLKPLRCSQCKKVYCSKCMQIQHKDNCEVIQLNEIRNKFQYRTCKKCLRIIQKKQGCDHMTCPCKYQFCYLCQQEWKSTHKCTKAYIPEINPQIPKQPEPCCDRKLAVFLVVYIWIFPIDLIYLFFVLNYFLVKSTIFKSFTLFNNQYYLVWKIAFSVLLWIICVWQAFRREVVDGNILQYSLGHHLKLKINSYMDGDKANVEEEIVNVDGEENNEPAEQMVRE